MTFGMADTSGQTPQRRAGLAVSVLDPAAVKRLAVTREGVCASDTVDWRVSFSLLPHDSHVCATGRRLIPGASMNSRKSRNILLAAVLGILPLTSFYTARSVTSNLRRAAEPSPIAMKGNQPPTGGLKIPAAAGAAEPIGQDPRPSPTVPAVSGRERPEIAKRRLRMPAVRTAVRTDEATATERLERTRVRDRAPIDKTPEPARTERAQAARAERPENCPPCPQVQPCPPVEAKQTDPTVRPAASFLLMPAPPSTFRSAVDKVPLLRRLQRGRYKAGEGFVPARPISAAPPEVPTTLDNQSTAVVIAEVGESGEVRKAERRKGDETLGAIAAEAVRNWQFEPATLAGEPVSSKVIVRFTVNSARLQQARND